MSASAILTTQPAGPAVLLVLLPPATPGAGGKQLATLALLQLLQQRLGKGIRVLKIDETTHPAVVRSFQPAELPACVLVQQGVELWRRPGLPSGADLVPLLQGLVQPTPSV